MTKNIPQHKDRLGRIIQVGDIVVALRDGGLYFQKITKLTPCKVSYERTENKSLPTYYPGSSFPNKIVVVNEQIEINKALKTQQENDDPNTFRVKL